MIENKVLIRVNVPLLEKKYDVYVPVNRKVHSVIKMMKVSLSDLSLGVFSKDEDYLLYNAETGTMYDMNTLIRDTDIRNGSEVIMLKNL
jgi:hypothetical protein